MNREDLEVAILWATKEGWNPGLFDADAFYAADPNGFFVGCKSDEPISSISAVKYGNDFGFIGFYIVKPEFRKQGYGIKIWRHALAYLGKRNIGLDGVVSQQNNYIQSGFKLAYRNIRYQGKSKKHLNFDKAVIPLTSVPLSELVAYDMRLFPAPRIRFLKKWIYLPESTSFGFQKNGKLAGYVVVRKCKVGYKIGPLFADDETIAQQLFFAANNYLVENSIFYLDVPEPNSKAVSLAENNDMKICFETARMYTQNIPSFDLARIFGVTSFELG
jgi:ribosomal protein S18 acetylase RimI-like enzyme